MTSTYRFRDFLLALDYKERAVRTFNDLDFQMSDDRVSITGKDTKLACELAFYMGGDRE